ALPAGRGLRLPGDDRRRGRAPASSDSGGPGRGRALRLSHTVTQAEGPREGSAIRPPRLPAPGPGRRVRDPRSGRPDRRSGPPAAGRAVLRGRGESSPVRVPGRGSVARRVPRTGCAAPESG